MKEEDAMDFYNRVAEGTKRHKEVSLEHGSGATLDGVEMHPVDKRTLARVIEKLPEEMFEAANEADDAEEAEEMLDEEDDVGLEAVTEQTVEAFEELCKESLRHDDLAPPHMKEIVNSLSFEVLFELGSEVITMSVEDTGDVQDFHGL